MGYSNLKIREGLDLQEIINNATNGDAVDNIILKNTLCAFREKSVILKDKSIEYYMLNDINFTVVNGVVESVCDSNSDDAIDFYEMKRCFLDEITKPTIVVSPDGFEFTNKITQSSFVPSDVKEWNLNEDGDRVIQSKIFGVTIIASGSSSYEYTFAQGYTSGYNWAISEVADPTYDKVKKLIEEIDFEECINYNIELKGHVWDTIEEYR